LLDHGYSVLAAALRLRDIKGDAFVARRALLSAAEAIESAVRRGPQDDPTRGFHTVVAAAAFHLARYAARSYCLLPSNLGGLNLSSSERALALLLRRNFAELRSHLLTWLLEPGRSDRVVAARLADENDTFDTDDLLALALATNFHRALGALDFALATGDGGAYETALRLLRRGCAAADKALHVPLWWVNTLARHLTDELWDHSLHVRLPSDIGSMAAREEVERWSGLRRDFISLQARRQLSAVDLWPSQLEAAARAVDPVDDLVVALPTSAGKTRIAELCILRALAAGRRVVYVTPLRALSAQVEHGLARIFRPLGFSVSALYGASGVAAADAGTLRGADIVVATPEKLDFSIRQQPDVLDSVGLVVLDEGHMIGLGTREIRYEVLVQRLLRRSDAETRRIVCLSAIFSPGEAFADFTAWLRSDRAGQAIHSDWRPTRPRPALLGWTGHTGRLDFLVDEAPFVPRFIDAEAPRGKRRKEFPKDPQEFVLATVKRLLADDHSVLVYCPEARSVEPLATLHLALIKQGHLSPAPNDAPRERLARALAVGKEWLGKEHVAVRALNEGVAVHHGGLPRAFLAEVEDLLAGRHLRVAIASPTLAQGVDLSCSALVLRSIHRGTRQVKGRGGTYTERMPVPAGELANVMGRAGRAFVDLDGLTIYPIFDSNPTTQRQKSREFSSLLEAARDRQLRSGIVELVWELAVRLREHLGANSWEELEEYVLNSSGIWESGDGGGGRWHARSPAGEDGSDAEETSGQKFSGLELLDDLDTAILASVDRLDCAPEEIAAALDEALQSSLWRRHLAREPTEIQGALRELLTSRARWIWESTKAEQRRAFFASGLGHRAGSRVDANLEELSRELALSDANFAAGNVDNALEHLLALARFLIEVPTFSTPAKLRPVRWEEVLVDWVRGVPLGEIIATHGEACVRFIQDGLVFRMVWALEAVRAQATSGDPGHSEILLGNASRAVTYGVPSLQAALLVHAGIPSRSMALRLLTDMPGDFTDMKGLNVWLASVGPSADRRDYWRDAGERAIWSDLQSRRHGEVNREWHRWEERLDVEWAEEIPVPEPWTPLRLLRNSSSRRLLVCSADLHVLGWVSTWPTLVESACVLAWAEKGGETVVAECFGPAD
jgi:hypothetical protein